ncbi:hypothetical protein HOLleu_09606 [Holothuria leucospilota]|uniref:SANT and BTB domain-containing protein n=1 Tax=Holothuria leucospilota TaxID=206669 RepID=A0A9Q1CDN6_HOLLE|nr:hypothetical protein HOLleu_09606 [Holothuria leucospilota]
MKKRDNPSRQVAIDLILRTFMNTSGFTEMEPKNWDAISRLIPGSSAQECMKRFEALKQSAKNYPSKGKASSFSAEGKAALKHESSGVLVGQISDSQVEISSITSVESPPQQLGAVIRKQQDEMPPSQTVKQFEKGPNMVIHVCDEAKSVKKDFTCPRDLLVEEMKYFAEYLSNDAHRWEDVDISVHCDVQIFDWLMSYVKRDLPEYRDQDPPNLEPGNVISILISSDFLKMDILVEDCIQFCHKHMSEIIATPCNMNCINDKLCTRITDLFTDCEVDDVKDKKDKFKSKLFVKKIESLLGHGGPGSTLFRCQFCKRLLTQDTMETVRCLSNRISIGRNGDIQFYHKRDPSWDINDTLVNMKKDLKSWRNVYWRLWGSVTCFDCARCKQTFPCCEFKNCQVHPEKANFICPGLQSSPVGSYGCCNRKAVRFENVINNSGCEITDHVIKTHKEGTSDGPSRESILFDILESKKDVICTSLLSPDPSKSAGISVFTGDESLPRSLEDNFVMASVTGTKQAGITENEIDFRDFSTDDWESSDDEIGDEEQSRSVKSKVIYHPRRKTQKKSSKQVSSGTLSTSSSGSKSRQKWDSHRSLRWNQDSQREEDRHRIDDLVQNLMKQRQDVVTDMQEKSRQREYAGGLFNRLESQFKSSLNISRPTPMPVQLRQKLRLGQVRAT